MEKNKYLPAGSIIAKKYEVIETLGEDEFEILYLVRDIKRKGSFFVLKELFLETFSSREGELVFTVPEALGVFHKRKKQIIEEVEAQKLSLDEIKVYGYEDENNTIYTIMEFSNNASLEKYLQFTPKDVKSLPVLDELLNKKKIFNYSIILKILLLTGLLLGIAFYAYSYFQKNSLKENEHEFKKPVSKNFPKLKERKKEDEKSVKPQIKEVKVPEAVKVPEEVLAKIEKKPVAALPKIAEKVTEKVTEKITEETILEPIIPKMIFDEDQDEESKNNKRSTHKEIATLSVASDTSFEEKLPKKKKIVKVENDLITIDTLIKEFLDEYIMASATSVEDTMKFYDKKVKKYFRFNHPSHKTIIKSQKRYNKKWVKREFEISDFKIVKIYKKNNVNYYNLKTTTVWHVRNKRGKKLSGKSRGFMTLKEVGDSFKITSIYSLK